MIVFVLWIYEMTFIIYEQTKKANACTNTMRTLWHRDGNGDDKMPIVRNLSFLSPLVVDVVKNEAKFYNRSKWKRKRWTLVAKMGECDVSVSRCIFSLPSPSSLPVKEIDFSFGKFSISYTIFSITWKSEGVYQLRYGTINSDLPFHLRYSVADGRYYCSNLTRFIQTTTRTANESMSLQGGKPNLNQ